MYTCDKCKGTSTDSSSVKTLPAVNALLHAVEEMCACDMRALLLSTDSKYSIKYSSVLINDTMKFF
jgi:hypothetical protein